MKLLLLVYGVCINVFMFRMQCKQFLLKIARNLLAKAPILYSLVRHLSAFDPREMTVEKLDHNKTQLSPLFAHSLKPTVSVPVMQMISHSNTMASFKAMCRRCPSFLALIRHYVELTNSFMIDRQTTHLMQSCGL